MTVHRHCCCTANPICVLNDLPWKCDTPGHCYNERIRPFQPGTTMSLDITADFGSRTFNKACGGTVTANIEVRIVGTFELISDANGCRWVDDDADIFVPAIVTECSNAAIVQVGATGCVEIPFSASYLSFTAIRMSFPDVTLAELAEQTNLIVPGMYGSVSGCGTGPDLGTRIVAVNVDLGSVVPASVSHKYFWQLGGTVDAVGASDGLFGSATIEIEFGALTLAEDYSWLALAGTATPTNGQIKSLSLRYTNWCGARTYYALISGSRCSFEPTDDIPEGWFQQCEGLHLPCPSHSTRDTAISILDGGDVLCCNFGCFPLDKATGVLSLSGRVETIAPGYTETYNTGTGFEVGAPYRWKYLAIPMQAGINPSFTYNDGEYRFRYLPGSAPVWAVNDSPRVDSTVVLTTLCTPNEGDPCFQPEVLETYTCFNYAIWSMLAAPAQA